MTTAQDWVNRIRGRVLSGVTEWRNKLATGYTAPGTTLSLTYDASGIGTGTRVAIGQTIFVVLERIGNSLTVVGGEDGSPDVSATSGALVQINPRFPDWHIFTELSDGLASLSPRLWQMKPYEFSYDGGFGAFDLTGVTDLLSEYQVQYQLPGSTRSWLRLPKQYWRVDRNANTTDFPSGNALRIDTPLFHGYKVRFLYKSTISPFAAVTDNVTVTGLATTAYDIPPLAAFVRLAAGRELKRAFIESQPDPRSQEEVPPSSMLRAYQGIAALLEQRIGQEMEKLAHQWPERSD